MTAGAPQTTPPLVSCIMPTYNRRRFISQAIWYFLRQDYPRKELIIVDDGEDAVRDLVPRDERIRYLRPPRRMPLGAKRNLACSEARGELIAHCDDDDWIAPDRLSLQAQALAAAGGSICGSNRLLHYVLNSGEAWLYRPLPADPHWMAGGTLMYRRELWERRRFPELASGEDSAFIRAVGAGDAVVLNDFGYVCVVHSHNASGRNLQDARWQRRPLDEAVTLLAPDRPFYVRLRHPVTAPPAHAPGLTLAAAFMVYDGYGSMGEHLALGLARAGANINLVPLNLDAGGLSGEFQAILRRSRPDPADPVLYFSWPRAHLERVRTHPNLFVNTMWESSELPAGWVGALNGCRAVIVPSTFLVDVFRRAGLTVPIEVVPEGVDPDIYRFEERSPRDTFTGLMVGSSARRKHVREGIEAWRSAFAGDDRARLVIKSRYVYGDETSDDPRIIWVTGPERSRGIAHWYRQADVLMALGNEGFGLPMVEAMATGLPVIALDSEGQADVCREAQGCLIPIPPAGYEPAVEPAFGACGVRAVPDVSAVASALRWIAGHRDEALAMGRRAAEWVPLHRDIRRKAPAVLDIIERYSVPARTLRRAHTLWVPSWGGACGVAEYTAHLAAALPSVRAGKAAPDPGGVRLLHVQHEASLFSDAVLLRRVQEMRARRVPVAVTEHAVDDTPRDWEREADALVALTRHGAARLRRRRPEKRIEHLPMGCPTPVRPRQRKRGRTIGSFGFLWPHKGYWRILDALRRLPGSDLLLFSYAHNSEVERAWESAAVGLPVRRVREFLPVAEIMERLAAEADVLVLWYDEAAHSAASYAARIALATGVPVLTSRTRWFEDLENVTHQPADLEEGIARLLDDSRLRDELTAAAYDYCQEHSWHNIAQRHLALWRTLEFS